MARSIVIVAHPGALGVELLGVRDILELANKYARGVGSPDPFAVDLATHDGMPIRLWRGLDLGPVKNLRAFGGPIDTLIVVGSPVAEDPVEAPDLVAGVRDAAGRSRRIIGISTGALILGAAGLLDGHRCTTHWAWGDILVTRYPLARVHTRPIFVDDGDVWTAAGVTSGFEMLLALIEKDVGRDAARYVEKLMLLYRRRTGNQAQFTEWGEAVISRLANRDSMRTLQQYIFDNPAADLTMNALAKRVMMSQRHLARVFRAETGMSPHQFVESARLQTARRLLEESDLSIEIVATRSGFGNYENLRRVFSATLGVSPKEYRLRFGPASAGTTDSRPYKATAT